jgi:hypothetical protein
MSKGGLLALLDGTSSLPWVALIFGPSTGSTQILLPVIGGGLDAGLRHYDCIAAAGKIEWF